MHRIVLLFATAAVGISCQAQDPGGTRVDGPNAIDKPSITWQPGAKFGIAANGGGVTILSGTGRLDHNVCGAHVTGDVTADGKGGVTYSNVTNGTTTSEYWDGARLWKPGAMLGATEKSTRIGVLAGSGKLDLTMVGAHVTGDVNADGKGGVKYSNVTNGVTTSEYWDGMAAWNAGAVLGVSASGTAIAVLRGIGKLDFEKCGAHVTGDATADGNGGVTYNNVKNGTTTKECWDGTKAWKAGAALGPLNRGKQIGIVSGTASEQVR